MIKNNLQKKTQYFDTRDEQDGIQVSMRKFSI